MVDPFAIKVYELGSLKLRNLFDEILRRQSSYVVLLERTDCSVSNLENVFGVVVFVIDTVGCVATMLV